MIIAQKKEKSVAPIVKFVYIINCWVKRLSPEKTVDLLKGKGKL